LIEPKVAVIVINHNGQMWLHRCFSSIAKSDYSNLDIYLVDNGSLDGSVEYVKTNFPSVEIIAYARNLGFSEAYNRAIERVEADFVVILNSDTEVLNRNWISRLVSVATADPKTVAVACKMVSMDDHSRLDSVGGMGIPFWRGFVDIGREEYDQGQYDPEGFEPFAFCGGAALIKRDVFLRLGGFDGKFFLYVEDADFSWRLRLRGYKIGFAPEAKVAHYFSGSAGSKEVDAEKLHYCHRNLLRAIIKCCGSSLGWSVKNYLLFSFIVITGFCILQPTKAVAMIRALLWNLFNLRDTYSWRLRIQTGRIGSESEILTRMYPGFRRHEPAKHVRIRRILNTLFEDSQFLPVFRDVASSANRMSS